MVRRISIFQIFFLILIFDLSLYKINNFISNKLFEFIFMNVFMLIIYLWMYLCLPDLINAFQKNGKVWFLYRETDTKKREESFVYAEKANENIPNVSTCSKIIYQVRMLTELRYPEHNGHSFIFDTCSDGDWVLWIKVNLAQTVPSHVVQPHKTFSDQQSLLELPIISWDRRSFQQQTTNIHYKKHIF